MGEEVRELRRRGKAQVLQSFIGRDKGFGLYSDGKIGSHRGFGAEK